MRVSLNWLKSYVDIDFSPEELAGRLTMAGLEVESIERQGDKYEKFVVGQVLEVAKHPNADRLSVCSVNTGAVAIQVVCGAPNVASGQKVAVGLEGGVVPHNQHDPAGGPFLLSHVKVRNVDSYGMICSAYELDLGEDKEGILILEPGAEPGTPLARYLGVDDTVLEIGITPNRPDAMSHIGISREIAAFSGAEGTSLRIPRPVVQEGRTLSRKLLAVRIEDPEGCPRYSARVIRGVRVGPSPGWMQKALSAVGIRPVNNIVDCTNFVLMEIGHPLHAFDYARIEGGEVVVRRARPGERFTTLDHKERTLRPDTLLICDGRKPVAIAGVMGGENSEISSSTTDIILESAYFQPQTIRRTSKAFGLSTDASARFERGADPDCTLWAVDRAASLIQEVAGGGEVLKGILDVYPKKIPPRRILLRPGRVNQILGTQLTGGEITRHLEKVAIVPASRKRAGDRSPISFRIPTYRPDITAEIDLVEEVARLFGYNNIETKAESLIRFPDRAPVVQFTDELRAWLVGAGYNETIVNSMQESSLARIGADERLVVTIANPISKEMSALRTSLIPSMLGIVRHNLFHGAKDLRLFEIGKSYRRDPAGDTGTWLKGYIEEEKLLLVLSGLAEPISWGQKARNVDVFDLKGEVQALAAKISLDKIKFIPYSTTDALTDLGIDIEIQGAHAGRLGSVRQELLKMFEIDQPVFVAEISVLMLEANRERSRAYMPLPKFPPVARDLAFSVGETVPVEGLEIAIRESGGPLLKSVSLFDVYRGEQIGAGKKGCAFSLVFLSQERTLTQEEVDRLMQRIVKHVSSTFSAVLRK